MTAGDAALVNRRAYDAGAGTYREANANREPVRPLLDALAARLSPGNRIIDLGCGPGWETQELNRRGFPTTGFDLSPVMLRLAASRCRGRGYVLGDLRRLPLRSGSFEGAWASGSLLHVEKTRIDDALREIARVLTPGGVIACSVQAGTAEGLVEATESTPQRFYAYYEPDEWRRRLEGAGFDVESVDYATASAEHLNTGATGWITALARR